MKKIKINALALDVSQVRKDIVCIKNNDATQEINFSLLAKKILDQKIESIQEIVCGINDLHLQIKPDNSFNISQLESISLIEHSQESRIIRIAIDFEKGNDWALVSEHSKLNRAAFIDQFLACEFTFKMYGFLPGFIYLDGLESALQIPRKKNPARLLAPGAVGIGGAQCGIYSMPSPGGWNIIGQTNHPLFKPNQQPPLDLEVGNKIQFIQQ